MSSRCPGTCLASITRIHLARGHKARALTIMVLSDTVRHFVGNAKLKQILCTQGSQGHFDGSCDLMNTKGENDPVWGTHLTCG